MGEWVEVESDVYTCDVGDGRRLTVWETEAGRWTWRLDWSGVMEGMEPTVEQAQAAAYGHGALPLWDLAETLLIAANDRRS